MESFAWLLAGLIGGLGNALFFHFRLQPAIAARTILRAEADGFVRGFALWVGGPCVAIWLLQMTIAGPAAINFLDWPWPQKGIAIAMQCAVLAALVRWIFLDDGAAVTSRVLTAARRPVFTDPRSIKWLVAATVVVNLAGALAHELQAA